MLMLAFTGYVTKTPQPTVIYPKPAQMLAAIASKYQDSCTPERLKYLTTDKTGALYMAGCDDELYMVTVDPRGMIAPQRMSKYGRPERERVR